MVVEREGEKNGRFVIVGIKEVQKKVQVIYFAQILIYIQFLHNFSVFFYFKLKLKIQTVLTQKNVFFCNNFKKCPVFSWIEVE